jgi:hypothetical protein
MAKRNLTEKQQRFLEVLFEEAQGNFVEAKRLAGYSDNVYTQSIVDSLEEEIFELTKKYISKLGVKAAWSMQEVMLNPTDLGNKEKMAAAKDILDRGGFKPTEKVDVKTDTPVFILPAKIEKDDE